MIQEYSAGTGPAGPADMRQAREADTGFVGSSIARAGEAVSGVSEMLHKKVAQDEVSSLSAKMAEAHVGLSQGLDVALHNAKDGEDVTGNAMQSYDDQMSKLSDGISTPEGRHYFNQINGQMRANFLQTAMKGQAAVRGQQVVDDHTTMLSGLSTSVYNAPGSFESIRQIHETALDAMVKTGRIDQDTADKLQASGETQLAQAAIKGMVVGDPQGAKAQLAQGKWDEYLNSDQKFALQREVETGIRAKEAEKNRQDALESDAVKEQQEATRDKFIAQIFGGKGGLPMQDIITSNLPATGPGSKYEFIKMNEAQTTKKPKTNAAVYEDLFDRIHRPDGDPQKITDPNTLNQYVTEGRLSLNDLNGLRKEIQGRNTPDGKIESDLRKNFLDMAKTKLVKANPMLGLTDPDGQEQFLKFNTQFQKEYASERAKGKSATQLLDPSSPDYMGRMITPFMRTPQEIMKSMSQRMQPSSPQSPSAPGSTATPGAGAQPPKVEPRLPGESPAAYRARVGNK